MPKQDMRTSIPLDVGFSWLSRFGRWGVEGHCAPSLSSAGSCKGLAGFDMHCNVRSTPDMRDNKYYVVQCVFTMMQ